MELKVNVNVIIASKEDVNLLEIWGWEGFFGRCSC